MSNIKAPHTISTSNAMALATKTAPTPAIEAKGELVTASTYQFPSAPCAFVLPNGKKILAVDGTYSTEDPYELLHLDEAVAVNNIWKFNPAVPLNHSQIMPPIVSPDKIN